MKKETRMAEASDQTMVCMKAQVMAEPRAPTMGQERAPAMA